MYRKLSEAATYGDAKFIEEVVETDKTLLLEVTIDGNSALHIAAKHDREQIATQVSEAQPTLLTLPNMSGDTPLHLASAAGHLRIVNLLISQYKRLRQHLRASSGGVEEKEDENDVVWMATANKIGNTALHAATIGGHRDVVTRLLETAPQLAKMTNRAGVSALYMAAERGSQDIAETILESPAVSHEGPRGQTALHAAVLRSHEISRMILDKNPSCLKHQDASESTPLHFAADSGDVAMLQFLLQLDADAGYMQDKEGLAIIHIAASAGYLNMIKEILVHCPDALEQKNDKGSNFFHVAVRKKNLKAVKYVLSSYPSSKELLNEQDHEGNTPLHLAVLARGPKMIQMLLSSRIVDTALMDNSGFTPIDLASSNFRIEVSLRMYNIMTDLISYASRFSPQRVDHLGNHLQRKQDEDINPFIKKEEDENINRYQAFANILSVIAALIATVTFAAAFTLPGGYKNDSESDEGMAILSSKASFKVFLISDAIAMACSIIAVLLLINSGSRDRDVRLYSLATAWLLLALAVSGMIVAFVAGVYTVIERHSRWIVFLVCLISYVVPFVAQLVTTGQSTEYLNIDRDLDPEELIRQLKRKSNFMDDDTTRGQAKWKSKFTFGMKTRIYLLSLGLPPTLTILIQNYLRD